MSDNKEFRVRHGLVVGNNVLVANVTSNTVTVQGTLNAANILINGAAIEANLAPVFTVANGAYSHSNTTYAAVNSAFAVINAAFDSANNVAPQVKPAFDTANAAFDLANTKLSSSGGTIAGDLVVTGNATFSGVTTYANTQTLLIGDNIITLNNDIPAAVAPTEDAGVEVKRGTGANVSILWREGYDNWTLTNDGTTWYNIATNTDVSTVDSRLTSAYGVANSAFGKSNTALQNTSGTFAGDLTVSGNTIVKSKTLLGSNAASSVYSTINIYDYKVVGPFSWSTIRANNSYNITFNNTAIDDVYLSPWVTDASQNTMWRFTGAYVYPKHYSNKNLNTFNGIYVNPEVGAYGNVSQIAAIYAFNSNLGYDANTIVDYSYAVLVDSPGWNFNNSIKNNYGIYIFNQNNGAAPAAASYNFYSAGATSKNYFAGNTGFGTTSPVYKVDVVGTVNASSVLVNGANLLANLNSAYAQVNTLATSANAYAAAVGVSANTYSDTLLVTGRAYTNTSTTAANTYAGTVGTSANAYAATVGTSTNNYTSATYSTLTQFGSVFGVANGAFGAANTKVATVAGTSGRITSSGTTGITLDLATAGLGAASYSSGISALTVDAYGRVTSVTGSAGYTTNAGTVTSVSGTGTVSGLSLSGTVTSSGSLTLGGTLSASIDNITDEPRLFNNMGDNHSTYTDFNSITNFGVRYVQGSTNGPSTGSSQFYGFSLGLGNDYAYSSYAYQIAFPRFIDSDKYISIRNREGGTWSSWTKIAAGVADAPSGSIFSASGSFRAPIFYDLDNTGYYIDPAGGSNINTIYADGWFRSYGSTGWYNQTNGGGIYMEDGTWVRVYNNKQFYSQNYIQSDSSVRAPVFYDSNNTAYYINPEASLSAVFVGTIQQQTFPFIEHGKTISISYTISTNYNAMTVGPVTINTGVSVTIPTGSNWVVL